MKGSFFLDILPYFAPFLKIYFHSHIMNLQFLSSYQYKNWYLPSCQKDFTRKKKAYSWCSTSNYEYLYARAPHKQEWAWQRNVETIYFLCSQLPRYGTPQLIIIIQKDGFDCRMFIQNQQVYVIIDK